MARKAAQAKYKAEDKDNSSRHRLPKLKLRRIAAVGLLLGLLSLTVIGVNALLDPALFPIRTVQVRGQLQHVQSGQLQAMVAPYTQAGFLWLDVAATRAGVQSLPWVRSATVRRVWPDTLRVTVQEQTALARWGEQALVNDAGEVFSPARESFPAGLQRLDGPVGMSRLVAEHYVQYARALQPLQLQVAHLTMDGRHAWSVELDNGVKLLLGRDADGSRMQRFIGSYQTLLGERSAEIAHIDLRYTNGMAVTWKKNATPTGEHQRVVDDKTFG
ncbi:MAG: hypothetical protein A2V90_03550 [Gammaproteobacteria bacterium RBG_16_57_12]|nr:MAG: hypothetical protein A2V90_03550 [Gammaproteobacteria bacterium RBG_16_57_12]